MSKILTKYQMLRQISLKISLKVVAATSSLLILQDVVKKIVVYQDLANALAEEKNALIGKVTTDGINRFKYNAGRIKELTNGSLLKKEEEGGNEKEKDQTQEILQKSKSYAISRLKNRLNNNGEEGEDHLQTPNIKQGLKQRKQALLHRFSQVRDKVKEEVTEERQTVREYGREKIKQTREQVQSKLSEARQKKNQSLLLHHLSMGLLLSAGCFISPIISIGLSLTYFGTYQLYFFGETIRRKYQVKEFENMKFEPIYQVHLFAIGGIILVKGGFKAWRYLSKNKQK